MQHLTPEELKELQRQFNEEIHGFMDTCALHVDEITPDLVRMHMEDRPALYNPAGVLHGGALYTLADTCAGLLCRAQNRTSVTIKGTMDYFRPGKGRINAKARVLHKTKRLTTLCVTLIDSNDEVIAQCVNTYSTSGAPALPENKIV